MICRHCYERFLTNNISRSNLFEEGDEKHWNKYKIIRVSDNKELNLVKVSLKMNQEEFDKIKENTWDSHFLVLCRKYTDESGNFKIEYL